MYTRTSSNPPTKATSNPGTSREPSSQQSTQQRPRRSPAPTAAAGGADNQHPQLASFYAGVCAAAPRQAAKAKNQRSRNNYAGFRSRQSPARPKHRYNAKSRVDRRSTRVFAFSWRRGPAASNQGQKPA